MLQSWAEPGPRDRVLGQWRPLPARDGQPARDAFLSVIPQLMDAPAPVRVVAARLAATWQIRQAAPMLTQLFDDTEAEGAARATALTALNDLGVGDTQRRLQIAVADSNPLLRATARGLWARVDPDGAVPLLERAVLQGEPLERQQALETLALVETAEATNVLRQTLERLLDGELPPDSHLEVLEAAADRSGLDGLVSKYEATRDATLPASQFQESLYGGDAERGRQIFFERTQVSCLRCHRVGDEGGEVGPNLTRIGAEKDRQYLLEAVVDPNRAIAKGFESVMLADIEGQVHVGILKQEDEQKIVIMTAEGKTLTFDQEEIDDLAPGRSAMPIDLVQHLSKRDVRDLVAYLAELKTAAGDEHGAHGASADAGAERENPPQEN